MARRTIIVLLSVLALFLLGTVVVLSSVSLYLAIDIPAYITEAELLQSNDTRPQKIPRILHQTWKSETLPEKWQGVSQGCRELMPDYEYMLWTDESSRQFIEENYSWFLPTFDSYTYPIQRADAIRYFVLYHYGGVYLDLDVGCRRSLDPLLVFPVILPKTIPVGVSNDLMFSAKGHPFMEQTIHHLKTFDHNWVINYPTVMFSTGPMFLSAQYSLYTASHPHEDPREVRILPKSLYGKNAKPEEAPNSFFTHHYGSSWHADDAAFITFLGKWGKGLMWIGLIVLIVGVGRMLWSKSAGSGRRRRRGYELLLPRSIIPRNGGYYLQLRRFALSYSSNPPSSAESSPLSSPPPPSRIPLLPLSSDDGVDPNQPPNRGILFFLPAIFAPSSSSDTASRIAPSRDASRSVSPTPDKRSQRNDLESLVLTTDRLPPSDIASRRASAQGAPPPYASGPSSAVATPSTSDWNAQGETWDDWDGAKSK